MKPKFVETVKGGIVLPNPLTVSSYRKRIYAKTLHVQIPGIIAAIIQLGVGVWIPWLVGHAIDEVITVHSTERLGHWAGLLFIAALTIMVTVVLWHRSNAMSWLISATTTTKISSDHVSREGVELRKKITSGDILGTTDHDAHSFGQIYWCVPQIIASFVAYLIVSALVLKDSLQLGLLVLIGVPLFASIVLFLVEPLMEKQDAQRDAMGEVNSIAADTVAGLRVLRGVGAEHAFMSSFEKNSLQARNTGFETAPYASTMSAAQAFLPNIFSAIFVAAGTYQAIQGNISVGELITFYGYSAFLIDPIEMFVSGAGSFVNNSVAAKKILKLLNISAPSIETRYTALPTQKIFRLHLNSPDDLYQLRAVNDCVISPESAEVFSGTLRTSLDAQNARSDQDIMQAIGLAALDDVVESIADLDKRVDEKARNFSGGQRQRLALARAYLTSSAVLVLQEPTSALDAATEMKVAGQLNEACSPAWAPERTLVIVTASRIMAHACPAEIGVQDV